MKAPVSGSGTSASHGTAYAGQASFTWASGSPNTGTSIVGTIYNDNITGSSIVLFNLQGAASGSGVWVGDITTAPNGTNHNFTVTLQRRVSATLTTNDQCTVNYEIIN
jgi:hypothetical protein